MANVLYPKFKEACLSGTIALPTDTVKLLLVDDASYTYNAAHQYLSDVPVGARVSTSAAVTTKTVTDGAFDFDDPTFTAVGVGTYENIVAFVDTGTEGTSELIAFIDNAVGLPVTGNGLDIIVQLGVNLFQL